MSLLSMTWRDALFASWPVDPVGVTLARLGFRLPYYFARTDATREGRPEDGPAVGGTGAVAGVPRAAERVAFRSERRHPGASALSFDATYEPSGDARLATGLERFLVERYRFYAGPAGRRYGDIDHGPWPLYDVDAAVERNDLVAANGFPDPDGDPHLAYSPGISVRATRLRRPP